MTTATTTTTANQIQAIQRMIRCEYEERAPHDFFQWQHCFLLSLESTNPDQGIMYAAVELVYELMN